MPRHCAQSGGRQYNIDDDQLTTGIFLGYTGTDDNIYFEDNKTMDVKSSRHHTFDEVHYSSETRPPYAQKLLNNPPHI